jgi:hypothetical protein
MGKSRKQRVRYVGIDVFKKMAVDCIIDEKGRFSNGKVADVPVMRWNSLAAAICTRVIESPWKQRPTPGRWWKSSSRLWQK